MWVLDSADNVEEQDDAEFVNLPLLISGLGPMHILVMTRSPIELQVSALYPVLVNIGMPCVVWHVGRTCDGR